MSEATVPRVGVGIYIVKNGKVLIGKRKGGIEPGHWCAPGGKLDFGEEPEACAAREAFEETGVSVKNIRFAGYTSDILEGKQHHYITLQFVADWESGDPRCAEPEKFEDVWYWADWKALPTPQFIGLRTFVEKGYNPLAI